jgi:hypothetical protein
MNVVSCKTIYKYGKYKPQPQSTYIPNEPKVTYVPSLELGPPTPSPESECAPRAPRNRNTGTVSRLHSPPYAHWSRVKLLGFGD